MGQFSWLDCDRENEGHRAILDNVADDVYVLVPKEFGGGHILETEYDGYGNFGGYDIYDLVADWNKEYITSDAIKKPVRERYGGIWGYELDKLKEQGLSDEEIKIKEEKEREEYYQRALKRYDCKINRLEDFKTNVSDEIMVERYGKDWKREIGIDIACYDEDNARLKYPIKITHDGGLTYESAKYISLGDPNQGWGAYTEVWNAHFGEYEDVPDGNHDYNYAIETYKEIKTK